MSLNHENATQPEYGHRLIPALVDELARTTPNYLFALLPRSAQFADGLREVTISAFARAVNRAASWIESTVGKSTDFETIAYIGPGKSLSRQEGKRLELTLHSRSQVLYHCHRCFQTGLQGSFKWGTPRDKIHQLRRRKTLLPSPRNSVEGHLSLFDHTRCHTLLSPTETKIDHILAERPMRHFVVTTLDDFLAEGSVAQYTYDKSFENAAHDPFIVIHTSGSTGLPKPITIHQGGLATIDAHHLLSPLNGYKAQVNISEGPVRIFTSLPPFHVSNRHIYAISPC